MQRRRRSSSWRMQRGQERADLVEGPPKRAERMGYPLLASPAPMRQAKC